MLTPHWWRARPGSTTPSCPLAGLRAIVNHKKEERMTRVVFMGTPEFAVPSLEALLREGL